MMMTLSVALSGTAIAFRTVGTDRSASPRPSPVAAQRRAPRTPWEALDRTLPDAVLDLPSERFPPQETAGSGEVARRVGPGDAGEGPGEPEGDGADNQADAAVDPGIDPGHSGSPAGAVVAPSSIFAQVAAEGDRTRAVVGDIQDRLSASLKTEAGRLADEHRQTRDELVATVEQLDAFNASLRQEVRHLAGEYRQLRESLAGAIRQSVTWLAKSRDELHEKLDGLGRLVEEASSSAREDNQELQDSVTQVLADQRINYGVAVAEASTAERAASEPLAARIEEQAALIAQTLDQQKQLQAELATLREAIGHELHEKLDGMIRIVEKAGSIGHASIQQLRDNMTQALADQRVHYDAALAGASGGQPASFGSLSNLMEEQAALIAQTLEQQKQLQAELASLRKEIGRSRRSSSRAPQPIAVDDHQIAMLADAVREEVQRSATDGRQDEVPVRAGRARAALKKAPDEPPGPRALKRAVPKGGPRTSGAAAKVPVAKAARASTRRSSNDRSDAEKTATRKRTPRA